MRREINSVYSYANKDKGVVLLLDPITADVSIWDYENDAEILGERIMELSESSIDNTPSQFFKPDDFVLDVTNKLVAKEDVSVVCQILNAKPGTSIVFKMKDRDIFEENKGEEILEGYVTKLMWSNNNIYLFYDSSGTLLNFTSINYGVLKEDPWDIEDLLCEWDVLNL